MISEHHNGPFVTAGGWIMIVYSELARLDTLGELHSMQSFLFNADRDNAGLSFSYPNRERVFENMRHFRA